MPRAICIQFDVDSARAVIVEVRGAATKIVADEVIPWEEAANDAAKGARLANALAPHKPARVPVVAALARPRLSWQNYELPPAPPDDLADLVHLQAERDQLADDADAFDFLPLDGDADRPHRVIGVRVGAKSVGSIRAICDAAGLQLSRLTMVELGWPAFVKRNSNANDAGNQLAAAVNGSSAVIWAKQADQLVLLRTVQLPGNDHTLELRPLVGELQRSALSLSSRGTESAELPWLVVGDDPTTAAVEGLADHSSHEIVALSLDGMDLGFEDVQQISAATAPLIGLAINETAGRPPQVDLFHPRRRPKAPSRIRTFGLAGAAAAALAAAIGWHGYRNVRAPLEAAEQAAAQQEELTPMIEALADDVGQYDRIAAWLAASPNLLDELTHLSQTLRPKPLDAKDFALDQDAVATHITQAERQFTLTTAIRDASAAGSVENRLRDSQHRVTRDKLTPADEGPEGYKQQLIARIERIADAANPDESDSSASDEEGQP